MYKIGDVIQFEYNDVGFYGEIVPYQGHSNGNYSRGSYLVKLQGFLDPAINRIDRVSRYGWMSRLRGDTALYLWVDHTHPILRYDHASAPPRPVSPVFYMVKEAVP